MFFFITVGCIIKEQLKVYSSAFWKSYQHMNELLLLLSEFTQAIHKKRKNHAVLVGNKLAI